MRRILSWLAGGLGAAALVRQLLRKQRPMQAPPADPADDLRAKLQQAREAPDDRDEFDASEGTPVDEVEDLPAAAGPGTAEPGTAEPDTAEPDTAEPAAAQPDTAEPALVEPAAAQPTVVERPEESSAEERSGEEGRSLEERRRAVHDKAQEALGHMRNADDD